jgi:hypothetical protein
MIISITSTGERDPEKIKERALHVLQCGQLKTVLYKPVFGRPSKAQISKARSRMRSSRLLLSDMARSL